MPSTSKKLTAEPKPITKSIPKPKGKPRGYPFNSLTARVKHSKPITPVPIAIKETVSLPTYSSRSPWFWLLLLLIIPAYFLLRWLYILNQQYNWIFVELIFERDGNKHMLYSLLIGTLSGVTTNIMGLNVGGMKKHWKAVFFGIFIVFIILGFGFPGISVFMNFPLFRHKTFCTSGEDGLLFYTENATTFWLPLVFFSFCLAGRSKS